MSRLAHVEPAHKGVAILSLPLCVRNDIELMCCLQARDKWTGEVVELSWEPRAFLFKKFMTDEECDSLIAKVSWDVLRAHDQLCTFIVIMWWCVCSCCIPHL